MTQRRRMSRADVERTPLRTVMPGVSARPRWPDASAPLLRIPSRAEMEVLRHSRAIVDAQAREDVEAERRAVERTGRILVAWLIGRWRR